MNNNLNDSEAKELIKILTPLYNNKININKYKNITYNYEKSSINRYIKLIDIHTSINLSKTNTIYTVLRVHRNNKFINYGYIYGLKNNNEIVNKFILTSNSIISKDGMYSYRLVNYLKLSKNFTIIDKVYNYILTFIKNGTIKFEVDVFNIENMNIRNKYISKYKNSKILVIIYCIGWIIEMYNINLEKQDINLNQIYNDVMFGENDKQFYVSLYTKFKSDILEVIHYFRYFSCNNCNKLIIGQKVMTLNYNQLKEYNNIIHYQWKEILINKIVTEIIYNMISPSFAMFIDWFLIKKSNRFIYDNENIYNKVLASDKSKELIYHINSIKDGFTDMYNKKRTKILAKLIKKFKQSMELIENNILMSDVSICLISEYAGQSLYQYLLQNKEIYTNLYDFQKYIFEILYGLYILNIKGIIHGDLHLSNILLNEKHTINDINNHVIYNLNLDKEKNLDKNSYKDNIYSFKHRGIYACIIDYSRSFINLNKLDHDIIDYKIDKKTYIKNDQKKIINELVKIFPNIKDDPKQKINFIFKSNNFEKMFTYFSAIDIFNLSSKLILFINNHTETNNIKINNGIIDLLTSLNEKAYNILQKIFDVNNYNNNEIQNPNLELINDLFKDFKYNSKSINVSDIFCLNNINNIYTKKNTIDEIIEHIPLNSLNSKLKKKLNNTKEEYEEIEIEQNVNKEYYESRKLLSLSKVPVSNTFSLSTASLTASSSN